MTQILDPKVQFTHLIYHIQPLKSKKSEDQIYLFIIQQTNNLTYKHNFKLKQNNFHIMSVSSGYITIIYKMVKYTLGSKV